MDNKRVHHGYHERSRLRGDDSGIVDSDTERRGIRSGDLAATIILGNGIITNLQESGLADKKVIKRAKEAVAHYTNWQFLKASAAERATAAVDQQRCRQDAQELQAIIEALWTLTCDVATAAAEIRDPKLTPVKVACDALAHCLWGRKSKKEFPLMLGFKLGELHHKRFTDLSSEVKGGESDCQ